MKPADIDRLCECAICHDVLQDAHICPGCSNPFCGRCIKQWLTRSENCPVCRKRLYVRMLVKARFYQQVQDVIRSSDSSGLVCVVHHQQQISLFCRSCQECICVTCMFDEAHAGHREDVVLCESAATEIKALIRNEMGWIEEREREINNAIGLHETNLQKLIAEKDRIFNNIQEVLDDVNGQFERGRIEQQDMITLLEINQKTNAALLQISQEWIKTEKIYEFLPKIANLLKTNHFNSLDTKPKPVKQIFPKFENDLIPDLVEFKLAIKESQTIRADPGFEFTVQLTPFSAGFYNVSLTMVKGIVGEYSLSLGDGKPLVPVRFELLRATPVGRIEPKATPSLTPIKIQLQLAKTYAQRCRQYEVLFKQQEEVEIRKQLFEQQNSIDRLKIRNAWTLGGGVLVIVAVVFLVVSLVGMMNVEQERKVICPSLVRFAVEQFCYDA